MGEPWPHPALCGHRDLVTAVTQLRKPWGCCQAAILLCLSVPMRKAELCSKATPWVPIPAHALRGCAGTTLSSWAAALAPRCEGSHLTGTWSQPTRERELLTQPAARGPQAKPHVSLCFGKGLSAQSPGLGEAAPRPSPRRVTKKPPSHRVGKPT